MGEYSEGPAIQPAGAHKQAGSVTAQMSLPPPDRASPLTGRRRHKVSWVIAVVIVLVAAEMVLVIANPFTSQTSGHPGVVDNAYPTSLAMVKRQTISSQTLVSAMLGYAGSYSVFNQSCGNYSVIYQACGTFTSLPQIGQVIYQGKLLYRVDGNPVVLLYGSTPAYRTLLPGAIGADVQQLNANLVALGDATSSQLNPRSDYFSSATTAALKKLQAALGVAPNGILTLGQAAFLPGPARVTTVAATLGGQARPGQPVLSATSTARQVTIALDTALQSEVKLGDKVTITLPDNTTTPGVITAVGSVATPPSSAGPSGESGSDTPTIIVEATPIYLAATGSWDQAPVQVSITTATVSNALVVPEDALVALSGGGYSVEVVDHSRSHHLVAVNLGIFDSADSQVQVSGSGLLAGQEVAVPGS